jgi:signal transduction histidine kinase
MADAESREAAEGLRELVVSTLQDVRRLAVELRPSALDDFGLVAALERLTGSFAEQTGIVVDFQTALAEERLPEQVETAIYRIVQESLTNVVKHARARRVSILLARKEDAVKAVVEDDGQGFDPAQETGGSGLVGMRERLALLGGRLTVESAPDRGTTVAVEVPVR